MVRNHQESISTLSVQAVTAGIWDLVVEISDPIILSADDASCCAAHQTPSCGAAATTLLYWFHHHEDTVYGTELFQKLKEAFIESQRRYL